jgi:hypothetical protein
MTTLPRSGRSVAPRKITIHQPSLVSMSEQEHRQAVAALSRLFAAELQEEPDPSPRASNYMSSSARKLD